MNLFAKMKKDLEMKKNIEMTQRLINMLESEKCDNSIRPNFGPNISFNIEYDELVAYTSRIWDDSFRKEMLEFEKHS